MTLSGTNVKVGTGMYPVLQNQYLPLTANQNPHYIISISFKKKIMEYVQGDQANPTKDLKVVGFYVNRQVYEEYVKMATELFQQQVPDGKGGSVPVIERPDPNLFLNFCVGFYRQYKDLMGSITQSPMASKMIEQMAETLSKSGIGPRQ